MTHFVLKKTLAAVAVVLAAMPLAHAAPNAVFAGGAGVLSFSNCDASFCYDGSDPSTAGGLISALNAGQVNIRGVGGALVTQGALDPADILTRYAASAAAQVTGATLSDAGEVLSVQSAGGVELFAARNSTLTGGSAKVTNLRFDLTNKTIYANLDGLRSAVGTRPAASFTLVGQALWTFDRISGPTVLPPAALGAADPVAAMTAAGFTVTKRFDGVDPHVQYTANNTISGLKVTPEGFDFFKNSLGLTNAGISALTAVTDYGVVNATLNFRTPPLFTPSPVPEPTTMSLTLLGLIGFAAAARRRSQVQAA
jgi:PEP-CTERM motif